MSHSPQSSPPPMPFFKNFFELLASMRFAVSLLVVVSIASIVGTIVEQSRPEIHYIDQFGTFWYSIFGKFNIAQIYNTWWFLLIMGFLVLSTTLCVIRHAPRMMRDMLSYRDYIKQSSLRAFPHRFEVKSRYSAEQTVVLGQQWFKRHGYKWRQKESDVAFLLAAKKGSSNRLGYIFAHCAIVLICIGGLLDSELLNRVQIWFTNKPAIPSNALYLSEVDPRTWFEDSNPSFRGNLVVSEGNSSAYSTISLSDQQYLQKLPFSVKLNKFVIEYYQENGMPKRFASEVTITDLKNGHQSNEVIEVNHPFTLHGVTLYQSSFSDGGSELQLRAIPLKGKDTKGFDLDTKVGAQQVVALDEDGHNVNYVLTMTDFAPINVENLSNPSDPSEPHKSLQDQVLQVTGSAANHKKENLHNVGPTFTYTLTDDTNQKIEFKNYMLPLDLQGSRVFLMGVKRPQDAGYTYVRIPADADNSMQEFLQLRAALADPQQREHVSRQFAAQNANAQINEATIYKLMKQTLDLFAEGGFAGMERFVKGADMAQAERLPESLREPMRNLMRDYVYYGLVALRQQVRQDLHVAPIDYADNSVQQAQSKWLQNAALAISDISLYPAPLSFELKNFKHIQASVLQTTRSPGKFLVYLGAIFLALGVFSMLYIRDRRIWFWVNKHPDGASDSSTIKAAMTSRKRNLDFDREFDQFVQDFKKLQ
ncbi:cytochrome c biogenesis protein ResB [Brackiella oedipodis]|uniref:cytochrome c biogenesis protein ResB n=1 Tax=Brackiella oedipodis TaxID=124225 RepID=UPI000684CEC7|nr:cytochrome c biogenesis protein ResB [Brackiella oedipodis]